MPQKLSCQQTVRQDGLLRTDSPDPGSQGGPALLGGTLHFRNGRIGSGFFQRLRASVRILSEPGNRGKQSTGKQNDRRQNDRKQNRRLCAG